MQACVCQGQYWYTTVLHLQWSLLRKELLVHVEQEDSYAAAAAAECCACLWAPGTAWGICLVLQPACMSPMDSQRLQAWWLPLPAPSQTLP